MGIKSSMNTTSVLIEKYINSAYDTVKTVYDNLTDINLVADSIDELEVINTYPEGTLTQYVNTLTVASSSITLVGVGNTDAIQVFVNGVHQSGDSFTFADTTLAFNEELPIGTKIAVYSSSNLFAPVDLAEINTVFNNLTPINTVNNNITNINNVNANATNINTVAARDADVSQLANELDLTPSQSFVGYVDNKVSTAMLNFNVAPNQADVLIYLKQIVTHNGANTFALPSGAITNKAALQVFINGVLQDGDSFNISGNDIVLSEGLTIGDIVSIYSSTTGTPITDQFVLDTLQYTSQTYTYTVAQLETAGIVDNSYTNLAFNINTSTFGNNFRDTTNLSIFVNGVYQVPGRAYGISGDLVIFTEELVSDDLITIISNRLPTTLDTVQGTLTKKQHTYIVGSTPDVTVGANTTVIDLSSEALSYTVNNSELIVFINGVQQVLGDGYYESNSTTITIDAALNIGDTVTVYKIIPELIGLEVDLPVDVVRTTATQTLSNKTISGATITGGTIAPDSVDIDSGAIDGTAIGANTPSTGYFTNVHATGNITVDGTVDGRDIATDGTNQDNHINDTGAHGANGAIVGTASIQTLTNKTLTAPIINGATINNSSLSILNDAPVNAGAIGSPGSITWDADYIYICVDVNTWKRVAITTWV